MASHTLRSVPARPPEARDLAADLLDAMRAGNSEALQNVLDLYWEPLISFAARIIGCDDTAEDVVQRAFIRFWEGRERWRSGSSPKLILYKIVRGLALNQLESDRARARRAAAPRMPRPTPVATPAQILDESELAGVLERALDGLSPRRKEALVLTRFHDLTHAEVADVMGLTQRTVTNHVTSALADLEVAVGHYLFD